MTNAILRGKPDAGNPHVRFDEGEVASAKPRRGSLLYKKIHPHQKPIALYHWIIATYGRRAKRIFDPFAGSGSLAIACKQLDRDYVGCEVDSTFYKAAYSRIYDNPLPQPTEEYLPLMPNQKVD